MKRKSFDINVVELTNLSHHHLFFLGGGVSEFLFCSGDAGSGSSSEALHFLNRLLSTQHFLQVSLSPLIAAIQAPLASRSPPCPSPLFQICICKSGLNSLRSALTSPLLFINKLCHSQTLI